MTPQPLILQIQQVCLAGSHSLADALRLAKVASSLLDLDEFGAWVDLELSGYHGKAFDEIPAYRKIVGIPQGWDAYQGWMPILVQHEKVAQTIATAPISSPIAHIESLDPAGDYSLSYGPPQRAMIWKAIGQTTELRLYLDVLQVKIIADTVRNILLDWTLKLRKAKILGDNLDFTEDEKARSISVTQHIKNYYHLGDVGAFVQTATGSDISGAITG
ncbi:MAG: AbiTii domain-containing protein [Caulobacteraceae bacterium]